MHIDRSCLHVLKPYVRSWSWRQKLRNPFAGLRLFSRASDGGIVLASRHWPHLLCWSWALSWRGSASDERRQWLIFRSRHNSGGTWMLCTPWGRLDLSCQDYDWMVSPARERDVCLFIERRLMREEAIPHD